MAISETAIQWRQSRDRDCNCGDCTNFHDATSTCRVSAPTHQGWPKVEAIDTCDEWAIYDHVDGEDEVQKLAREVLGIINATKTFLALRLVAYLVTAIFLYFLNR